MMDPDWQKTIDKINKVTKGDWNSPSSQLYLAATIIDHERALRTMSAELEFERAVNERVREVVKEMLAQHLAEKMMAKPSPWDIPDDVKEAMKRGAT